MHRRAIGLAGGVAALALAASAAFAEPEVTASATASVSAGYTRNPFLFAGDNTDSALVRFDLRPSLQLVDAHYRLALQSYYEHSQYLSHYDGDDAFGIVAAATSQVNSRLSLSATLGFDDSIIGRNNPSYGSLSTVTNPATSGVTTDGAAPVTTPVVTANNVLPIVDGGDVGLVGRRQRRELFSGTVGADYTPSARDHWNVGLSGSVARYPSSAILVSDYVTYGGNAGYSRQVRENITVGLQGSATFVDYSSGRDSRIYSPQITYTQRFSRGWSITGGVGAGITESTGAGTNASVSGQATLCHAGTRGNACLGISRSPSVNGLGGVAAQTQVNASYGYKINARSSIDASVGYTKNGSGQLNAFSQGNYVVGNLTYNRTVSNRVSLFVASDFRDLSGASRSVRADVSGRVGLTARIGRRAS